MSFHCSCGQPGRHHPGTNCMVIDDGSTPLPKESRPCCLAHRDESGRFEPGFCSPTCQGRRPFCICRAGDRPPLLVLDPACPRHGQKVRSR